MHYVTKLLTLVYAFYEHKPVKDTPEEHWGQWTIIDEN